MSVAVCRVPAFPTFDVPNWLPPAKDHNDGHRPAQLDIWNAIQADNMKHVVAGEGKASSKPYVHPLVRRSSSLMSQKSLEVCTESLGSETGSGESLSSFLDDAMSCLCPPSPLETEEAILPPALEPLGDFLGYHGTAVREREELTAVNYNCSRGARSSRPPRAFPPPLPSISRRDGPCLQMRAHRRDGRLVVEAMAVKPRCYLHAQRHGGRLRLCIVDCSVREQSAMAEEPEHKLHVHELAALETKQEPEEEEIVEEEEDDEMEEEEVEVVDRGTVVEVKVSTQPQVAAAGGAAKVHRSTLVINKFVGSTPLSDLAVQPRCPADEAGTDEATPTLLRRVPSSTTLAAAVAVASTNAAGAPLDSEEGHDDDDGDDCGGLHLPATAAAADTKLRFMSRRRDKQELLQSLRRCRQLRQKQLFILEPYCIATS